MKVGISRPDAWPPSNTADRVTPADTSRTRAAVTAVACFPGCVVSAPAAESDSNHPIRMRNSGTIGSNVGV